MNQVELKKLLDEFRALPAETEWLEFKEAKRSFDFDDIGKYFSALGNEANLKDKPCGWLIFGVADKTRKLVDTRYREKRADLDSLKAELGNHSTKRITFIEIYELPLPEGRVIMFQIPAAPRGIPIAWKDHYYARDGETLVALNIHEIEQIRGQAGQNDWSLEICDAVGIDDLNPEAVLQARKQFLLKNPGFAAELEKWDDKTFLNKAKLTIQGKVTRAALILLGKAEAEHFISPAVSRITWILKNEKNIEKDYAHFGPPLLLNIEKVFLKIRNLNYRYLPDNTLFPVEITQYDSWVLREALNNCVAHQNYELNGRITVLECPDRLMFSNMGNFMPGSVENVIRQDAPPAVYRNRFLADAMVNLNMIDTIGSGIKKMFETQRRRFFPLPVYDLKDPGKVTVSIEGKIIDPNYTRLLGKQADLDLGIVMLLDKVQRKIKISKSDSLSLKAMRLVEGRYPNLFVSARIAAITGGKAKYIKNRGLDKKYYQKLVVTFIETNGSATRAEINELVLTKLPDILTNIQKHRRINYLLTEMSCKLKVIRNEGTDRFPKWVLNRV